MRSLQNLGIYKAVLLASAAGTFALAGPAVAQDDTSADAQAVEDEGPAIVVTGSRIQRQDYQSNSPIVTVGEDLLQNSSTYSVEVNLIKLPQFVQE